MPSVSVILPAAGASTRFGGATSKVLQPLAGKPVFAHAIGLFARRTDVGQILLVVPAEQIEPLQVQSPAEFSDDRIALVPGGNDRTGSVRSALARVDAGAALVCVHDAVRPCISQERIDAVFAAAAETGAAILAWPIHGTIKRADDHHVAETIDRTDLWQAQTPQVFGRELLIEAYADGSSASDSAGLVERLGRRVRLVPGDPRNVKITTPADLALAEAALETLD